MLRVFRELAVITRLRPRPHSKNSGAGRRSLQTCAVVAANDVGDLAVVSGSPPYCDGLTTGEEAPIVLKDVACLITRSVGPDGGRLPSWQAVRRGRGRGLKSLTEKRRFQPSLVCSV